MRFDRVAILDWSAARGRRQGRDSIWLGICDAAGARETNIPTRSEAETLLRRLMAEARSEGARLLIGADFAFGQPAGFARMLTGRAEARTVWRWLAERVAETQDHGSTYRAVAAEMNAHFPGEGPFWGNGERIPTPGLPRKKPALPAGLAEHRATDLAGVGPGSRPKPVWQLAGAGAVGAQMLTGLPVLQRLCTAFSGTAVWPFDAIGRHPVVLAEVYPSLLSVAVKAEGGVPDQAQVRLLARALWSLAAREELTPLFDVDADPEEGWILGAGQQHLLQAALGS